MDLNAVAQDLFDELKSRYAKLTLGDDQAQVTSDPAQARFFKFNWNNNPVSVSIDEENLRLIYNRSLTDSVDSEQEQEWYEFSRFMKEFAVTHNLGFKPQDVEKLDLEQGDFEFLSQVNTVKESTMHGTSKTSYRPLDKTKMIIRHTKSVEEGVPGARSRNIKAIFIENNQGERFRFPYNYLNGARAMQMHVAKGGNPYDAVGEAIVNTVEDIAKMRKFTQYAQRNKMIDESTQQYIDAAHIKIQDSKRLLSAMQKTSTYESAVETMNTVIEQNNQNTVDRLVKTFTKETFDEDLVDAFKILPVLELKGDDEEETKTRADVMKQTSTASRFKNYVDSWVNSPQSKLILKKDDSFDDLQNNLRSQQKDTNAKLGTIMRDIAGRFLSNNPEDDAISNFASDMEQQLSMSGELFAKPNPEMKALKGTAIKLANMYLTDMKKIKTDDAYKDQVRKNPEDIKAFKDIKGKEIDKGKLAKQYKRKYKGETAQLEAWMDGRIAEMMNDLDPDDIEASEYQDAFELLEPTSKSPAADKIAQLAISRKQEGDDMDFADMMKASELIRQDRLKELGAFIYDLDTDPREEIMSMIEKFEPDTFAKIYGDQTGYMSLMKPKGMESADKNQDVEDILKLSGIKEDDEGSDKEKWLRYAKFWKYIMDIMAGEADADISDGFISADSIDDEPSYVTAKEMMQRAMTKQNTPWNDNIIDGDLDEYSSELNQDYEDKTDFSDMKKAALELIKTGKTQIVPYRGYPPMDKFYAENTIDEEIYDIVGLSGIK
jgi:F0F1-type ATP synthase delta subunit